MMRKCIFAVFFFVVLGLNRACAENPLVWRGGIHGREFSEVGRLYLGEDNLIHFRTEQRLYFFSHMYYIWDALSRSGVIADGKVIYDKPIRLSGNYSKAGAVYNFLQEPALRGSQIVWIDRVDKVADSDDKNGFTPLFDGISLQGWSTRKAPAAAPAWVVNDNVISFSTPSDRVAEKLISQSSYTDFELSFEYRSSWGNSASLLIRANEKGEGIALSLDHINEGTIGFPKSAAGASRPFMLHETREKRGVGASTHYHVQYDGRFNYDGVPIDGLLECCRLQDFLNEWDGGYWNVIKVRCVGADPEITVWVNGFKVSRFNAKSLKLEQKTPDVIGAVNNFAVHPSGRIAFAVHSTQLEEPMFLLRDLRISLAD